MSAKHTPGPWCIGDWGHIVAKHNRICTVAQPNAAGNTRLIVMAPELADALEWALDRIRSAGLGEGEKFAAAEAVLVKAVHS